MYIYSLAWKDYVTCRKEKRRCLVGWNPLHNLWNPVCHFSNPASKEENSRLTGDLSRSPPFWLPTHEWQPRGSAFLPYMGMIPASSSHFITPWPKPINPPCFSPEGMNSLTSTCEISKLTRKLLLNKLAFMCLIWLQLVHFISKEAN